MGYPSNSHLASSLDASSSIAFDESDDSIDRLATNSSFVLSMLFWRNESRATRIIYLNKKESFYLRNASSSSAFDESKYYGFPLIIKYLLYRVVQDFIASIFYI